MPKLVGIVVPRSTCLYEGPLLVEQGLARYDGADGIISLVITGDIEEVNRVMREHFLERHPEKTYEPLFTEH